MTYKSVICWWSGGITSAMACYLAIQFFGKENCRVIMIDTCNEDADTYRFMKDCEKLYGIKIERITAIKDVPGTEWIDIGKEYYSIEDVWDEFMSLNVATGAICSTMLKRRVREVWQENNEFDHQVFGFDFIKREMNRALSMSLNHPKAKAIFPLMMMAYSKKRCISIFEDEFFIKVPDSYHWGFENNNCLESGCTQGGIGYWQKQKRERQDKFVAMANREHRYTDAKGFPVTMLKDQSNEAKQLVKKTGDKTRAFVFLKKHPDYPYIKSIDEMPDCKVEPLFECNGFCGLNDLDDYEPEKPSIEYKLF